MLFLIGFRNLISIPLTGQYRFRPASKARRFCSIQKMKLVYWRALSGENDWKRSRNKGFVNIVLMTSHHHSGRAPPEKTGD
jgi:hypothetical protein